MANADTSGRPRTVDVAAGTGSILLSVMTVLLLPVLAAGSADAAELDSIAPMTGNWWIVLISLALQGIAIFWVGRAPRIVLIAVAALSLGISSFTPAATTGIAGLAMVVVVFLTVLRVPFARLGLALAVASAFFIAGEIMNGLRSNAESIFQAVLTGVLQGVIVIGISTLVAQVFRSRRAALAARHNEQAARAGERDAQIEAAIARERTAMARELHDIAAHHLSGIAIMAAAVDRQIDTAPEQARQGVRQLRAQSTTVLDDLRRIVGLLRDDIGDRRTVESLATVPELVDLARVQGAVELEILTNADRVLGSGVGPLTQLALYRTIQEALTNAANHASGARRFVRIDDRDDARAEVSVINSKPEKYVPPSRSGGFGLLGMRERADLVGAELRVGPTPEGGWQVRVSVTREDAISSDTAHSDTALPGGEPTDTQVASG